MGAAILANRTAGQKANRCNIRVGRFSRRAERCCVELVGHWSFFLVLELGHSWPLISYRGGHVRTALHGKNRREWNGAMQERVEPRIFVISRLTFPLLTPHAFPFFRKPFREQAWENRPIR